MKQFLSFVAAFCIALFPPVGPSPTARPVPMPALIQQTDSTLLRASFLDVGQGDCTFVELPGGETMLIDAGNPNDGDDIINFIETEGYDHLDFVIATHPHADHIGAMAEVLTELPADVIYMPKQSTTTKTFEQLLTTIEQQKIPLYPAKAGVVVYQEEDCTITLLAPIKESYSDLNNYSAVVQIKYGDVIYLLMGDAEEKVEQELLALDPINLKADVLKVGHHGSSYSSSPPFLKAVSPTFAVISCGRNNAYGHPHPSTLLSLKKYGAQVFRTDFDGSVLITTDGTTIQASQLNKEE